MKKPNEKTLLLRSLLLMTILMLFSTHAHARTSQIFNGNEVIKKGNATEYKFYLDTGFEYSDNVFSLTDSQISKMEENNREDAAGGRFKGMDSASDIIIEPSVGFKMNSAGPLGGKFHLSSSITYNYYTKNDKSNFPEGKLKLSNSIGKRGDLSLEASFVSGYFKKNYLSSVNDLNENGNIPIGERTYSSAVYDEYEALIAYNYEIIKKKHKKISGLDIEPFFGLNDRNYNSIFHNRDQKIAFGGLNAILEVASKFEVAIMYQYEDVSSPGKEELVLFDEVESGFDANGDGARKKNAPLITRVDRSSKRHTIEIKPTFNLSENSLIFLCYKRRTTDYTSGNSLDVEHYNIDARRQQFKTGITYKLSRAWSAEAEYCRTDDDNDEDGNYAQNNFIIKVKYNII